MNKTVTINISGIIFHIEENAYDSLSKYLSTIKGYFSSTDGGNEIMSDIEARIAELLQEKLNVGKQVILLTDVEYVQNVMGKPEEFGSVQEETKKQSNNKEEQTGQQTQEKTKRRLFRDPDEKAIGGVCSGLAAYFDIDTVWVRLAMFLLIFFGGLSLWVYIIMWIIIPQAKTTADKFAMRGEAANINNIFKSFKEEAEDVKERMSKYGNSLKNQNYSETIRTNTSNALNTVFGIVGRLFGFFLLVIGCILMLAYIISLSGITIANSHTDLTHWKTVIFESSGVYALGVLAFVIVFGIPVFMMLYAGVKLLFRIRYSNRWINLSLGLVWVLGIILGIYVTVVTVKQFSESSKIKRAMELHGVGDTLIVKMKSGVEGIKNIGADNLDDLENYINKKHKNFCFPEYNGSYGIIGFAGLTVVESNTDSVELIINQSSRGNTKREANENARAINYSYQQKGKELSFDEIFIVERGSKFRNQGVDIKLKLPKGKVIYFDKSVKYLLDDVENVSNTWDGDMISRRWKMTDKGLKCIDCENLSSLDSDDDDEKDIEINDNGIKVNGKNTQIKIDENGIKIRTPEKDIEVSKDKKEEK